MGTLAVQALIAAVLAAVGIKLAMVGGFVWFLGVLGWVALIASGGGTSGLIRAVAAGLAGMFWTAVGDFLIAQQGALPLEWVVLGIAVFLVVITSRIPFLGSIPAGLCGIIIMGSNGPMGIFDLPGNLKIAAAYVLGAVLGFIIQTVSGMVGRRGEPAMASRHVTTP
jgi:hypothetical protein